VVTVLIAARALNRAGALTLPFLAVLLGRRLHASADQIGVILSGYGLATIPSRLAGGRLADTLGARATIVLGLLATAAAQVAIALSSTLTAAAVSIVGLGLVFEIYEPPTQALLADHTPAADHPAVFGRLAAALAGAGIVAGLVASLLGRADLHWVFLLDAATCVGCAIAVHAAVRPGPSDRLWPAHASVRRPAVEPGLVSRRPSASFGSAFGDRRLLALLGAGTAFAIVYLQTTVVLPLTLAARHRPAADLGLLMTTSAVTIVAGQVVLKRRRWPRFPASAAGYLLVGAGFAATGLATTRPEFIGATTLWSTGDLILLGRATSIVAGLAPPGERGRYLATYGISWGVAAVVAPLTGTRLLALGGPAAPWIAAAAACMVLASLQPAIGRLVARGPAEPRTEPAPMTETRHARCAG
jgi:MFS family permease